MYGECVEYFDSRNDAIKYYFLEKIQMLLSADQIFRILEEKPKIKSHQKNKSEAFDFRKLELSENYDSK
jgi:hypothetical protein